MKTKRYTSQLDENVTRTEKVPAQKTDTKPTQEELLNGNQPALKKPKAGKKAGADASLSKALNRTLDEAAQEGNIGGG